mgnify:CR=1 FL=1
MPRKTNSRKEGIAKRAIAKAEDKFEEAKERSRELIQERPLTSIAIAAAVGALVALGVNSLFHTRKKSLRDKLRDYF